MRPRTLLIIGILAAIALAALWFTGTEDPEEAVAETGDPLLPGLLDRINEVERVTVRGAGERLVADLARGRDGGWQLRNRWEYPAARGPLRDVLIALGEARRVEQRTAKREQWPRLGLGAIDKPDADGMAVAITTAERDYRVLIGEQEPGGDGTFARTQDGNRAWLIDQRIERRLAVGDWLEQPIVTLALDAIERVVIEPVSGEPLRVVADSEAESGFRVRDVPEESTLLTPTIARSLARVVNDLDASEVRPLWAAVGLEPVAVARYETADGLILRLRTYTLNGAEGFARLEAATAEGATEDVAERAATYNEQWRDWVYRLPEHKFVNASHDRDRVILAPGEQP